MRDTPERPRARTADLAVKPLGDEVLVYDLVRHRAHGLDRMAAAVWRACDGARDPAALAAALRAPGGTPVPEAVVRYTLGRLAQAHLLTGPAPAVSRRAILRQLGTAAAVALPAVTSVVAPTGAEAQSCVAPSVSITGVCTMDAQCCAPGRCVVPPGSCCLPDNSSCTTNSECCSGDCEIGECVDTN
jgi:hypothetical protein